MKNNNEKQNKERVPVLKTEINLPATKGLYFWFCKNIAAMVTMVLSVLNTCKEVLKDLDYLKLVNALWIVNHMARKLEGICSISSSVHDNFFCKCRQAIKNCICSLCYAFDQQAFQNGLREHNILNGIILRNVLIPVKYFKALTIIFPYIRIESFGDVMNVTQARNYIRIIKAFHKKRCAIWSKNIEIWYQAFKLEGKPENTTFVHSSSKINEPDNIDLVKYDFVDHIFTVYDKIFAKQHNIKINCGGRKCMDCIKKHMNCYYRCNKYNNNFYINELLK